MKLSVLRELRFRRPMAVTEVVHFSPSIGTFPRCPRCHLTMEREYMSFCDRCGQKLDWTSFESATVIFVTVKSKHCSGPAEIAN